MKSLKQAFTMGFISAFAVLTATYFGLPTWVLFMAWTSHYLFGTNIKSAISTFVQQVLGILIAITIQYLGVILSETFEIFGFPITVCIVMTGIFFISKLKYLNSIPAYFLGIIIWFGTNAEINTNTFMILIIALTLGYVLAFANTNIYKRIELKHSQNTST